MLVEEKVVNIITRGSVMMESLKTILELQELDMNMLRLMNLKRKREKELTDIHDLRGDLQEQLLRKEHDVLELKKDLKLTEVRVREVEERVQELEKKQSAVKKVDEFNALSQEVTAAGREKANVSKQIAEYEERLAAEEEVLATIKESLESTTESSQALEQEIREGIELINKEGVVIKRDRDAMATKADAVVLAVYDRLLRNKKDRVLVPIESRACSGCHIVVTAQHENLVRKGEKLVFCEHCSRIHYWPSAGDATGEEEPKRRRRRSSATA